MVSASSISARFLPLVPGASIARFTLEATSPTTEARRKTWWSFGSHPRADSVAWHSVPFDADLCWRSRPEPSTTQTPEPFGSVARLCCLFRDADEHAFPVPFLCTGERAEHRNAHVSQPNGADLAMLERPVREDVCFRWASTQPASPSSSPTSPTTNNASTGSVTPPAFTTSDNSSLPSASPVPPGSWTSDSKSIRSASPPASPHLDACPPTAPPSDQPRQHLQRP